MITSRCLCESNVWRAEGPWQLMHHCHCSMCRKLHGSAFVTLVGVDPTAFTWEREGTTIVYRSSPGLERVSCATCGSPLPAPPSELGVFLPAGPLEGDPGERPLAHIFAASKAPWYAIEDDTACFDAYPPGHQAPGEVVPPVPEPGSEGGLRGSCLCGTVRYRITAEPALARHCHCSRCRRARGAAHASNLFVASGGFHFSQGEDAVVSWKLPEARFFTQAFCGSCGSSVPRVDEERGIAAVPMGSLDDDPGLRPACHIFTASKAPWFEIPGALPQHPEAAPA